jgi:hypothetical protein
VEQPALDIVRKLQVQPELFLMGVDAGGTGMATVMGGYDDRSRSVECGP